MATCQRIIVINKGQIVADDTVDRLTTRLKKGHLLAHGQNPRERRRGRDQENRRVADVTAAGPKLVVEIKPGSGEVRDKIIETAVKAEWACWSSAPNASAWKKFPAADHDRGSV